MSASDDTIQCICIDPAHVERVWPLVSHLIRAAMRKGRISEFADVERAVLDGAQLLWVAADARAIWAAAVTALAYANGEKLCTIVACGGRVRARWLPLKAELETFAKAEGCAAIRIHGRRGWARELIDPDSRSMATSGRGSGMVGYNVQTAVDTTNHLIVAHEVTNVGTDRSQLANMANQAKAALEVESLEAFADRGYFKGEEILECEEASITVTLPKPQTSGAKSGGRFGKQDFRYVAEEDVYICPAGEKLAHHFTNEEDGLVLRHYWTNACRTCALKAQCTKGPERRIRRWEHEHVVDAVQTRLDKNPDAMRTRRETVEHPFGTLKMRMGATHFLMRRLPKVATEMALHVLAYNLTRVMNIVGIKPLLAAIRA